MKHLIDKAAVVAEIEEWRDGIVKGIFSIPLTGRDKAYATFEYEILGKVRDFIDTLEVKEVDLEKRQKEDIDLEKEVNQYYEKTWPFEEVDEDIIAFARHFYELGLKNKGE